MLFLKEGVAEAAPSFKNWVRLSAHAPANHYFAKSLKLPDFGDFGQPSKIQTSKVLVREAALRHTMKNVV